MRNEQRVQLSRIDLNAVIYRLPHANALKARFAFGVLSRNAEALVVCVIQVAKNRAFSSSLQASKA
jgi:hypothetical protein